MITMRRGWTLGNGASAAGYEDLFLAGDNQALRSGGALGYMVPEPASCREPGEGTDQTPITVCPAG